MQSYVLYETGDAAHHARMTGSDTRCIFIGMGARRRIESEWRSAAVGEHHFNAEIAEALKALRLPRSAGLAPERRFARGDPESEAEAAKAAAAAPPPL